MDAASVVVVGFQVALRVTPVVSVDPHGHYELPLDLSAALEQAGQTWSGALAKSGDGPWRYDIRVRGEDRLEIGNRLHMKIRELGYQVELLMM